MATDFDQMTEPKRKQLVRFDPTISTGTILQVFVLIVGIAGAYSALDKGQAVQQSRLEDVERNASAESQRVKESLTEIKGDLKELQRTVNEVNTSLATLKR